MERLQVQPISRVQAIQRGGRAGRTSPGECFRLYTKRHFDHEMRDVSPPEILRTPLAAAVLHLKSLPAALGIDVLRFEFVDAPPREALEEALRQLHLLGAIDAGGIPERQCSDRCTSACPQWCDRGLRIQLPHLHTYERLQNARSSPSPPTRMPLAGHSSLTISRTEILSSQDFCRRCRVHWR